MSELLMDEIPVIQRVIAILWPSFITSGIATVLFTTAFDPDVLFYSYDVSRLAVYSMTFFLFWLFGAITAIATCFFLRPCGVMSKKEVE